MTHCEAQTKQQRATKQTSIAQQHGRTSALRCTEGRISSTQRAEGSLGSTQLQRAAQQ